jgi:hypothetical protein
MAVNLAALVRQPKPITISTRKGEVVVRPITCAGAELLERLSRKDPDDTPTMAEVIQALGDLLPGVPEAELRRLGAAETGLILHHAMGAEVEQLVEALEAETAASAAGVEGNGAARPAKRGARRARASH